MTIAAPEPKANMGQPAPRIDGRLKVTGAARYAADFAVSNPAYAVLVLSAIAKGRIAAIDTRAARAVPGVLEILTHENAANAVRETKFFAEGGRASTRIRPLSSPQIWHEGQIVGVVVADTFEAAREASFKVAVRYQAERPTAGFDAPGAETKPAAELDPKHEDPKVGDAEAALKSADVTIDAQYETSTQHHNPMELFATTCAWEDDRLTVYEPSQFVYGLKHEMAEQLGIDPAKVRVISPLVGGAFGSKGTVTPRTALVAIAAKRVGRPVKLVVGRDQGFTTATYRAETRHRIKLGARRDGKLTAVSHEGWEVTSRSDVYKVGGTETTARLYASPNVFTKVNLTRADRNTPGFMRSPPEVPYNFALETALDELAVKLGIDPVELRRINDTQTDPIYGARYTSRSLMACYDAAAKAFGWKPGPRRAGAMREGDWLVGWGCATATYPTQVSPAAARVKLAREGKAQVAIAAHDVGTGASTVIGQAAAERLGIPLDAVSVEIGDSVLPPGPIAGGSVTTASACSAVLKACDAVAAKMINAAMAIAEAGLAGADPAALRLLRGRVEDGSGKFASFETVFDRLGAGVIEEYAEYLPHGMPPDALKKLHGGGTAIEGGAMKDRLMYAFGAEFVEVRVHALTREIRVPRAVGAFTAGRIMNPRTARSQLMGGMIWGISSALLEVTEIDRKRARYVNDNLADYLVPVNADVNAIDVILLSELDPAVNPAGVKGLGELANVGMDAAVANAIFDATGKRIRRLPIRIDDLIGET